MGRALYRVGALVARHRVATVGIWMMLAVSAVVAVRVVGAKTNNILDLPGTDSQAAFDVLARSSRRNKTARTRSCSTSTTAP